jgi:DNA-binding transcriptional ArsR family regulator
MTIQVEVDVIEDTRRAQVLLQEGRIRLLEHLAEPSSAAALARRLDLPRQRVNYHLRELESQRLIELCEERRRGNVVERVYRRTGRSYAISTAALGQLGSRPDEIEDRFSAAFQIALASQAIREIATLAAGAAKAHKKLPTFALEVAVRFGSAARRSEFADALAAAVADLVREYHDEKTPGGRTFRFYVGAYPKPRPVK